MGSLASCIVTQHRWRCTDWGRTAATASTGLPQCSTATYGGGLTDVQGVHP